MLALVRCMHSFPRYHIKLKSYTSTLFLRYRNESCLYAGGHILVIVLVLPETSKSSKLKAIVLGLSGIFGTGYVQSRS